MNWDQIESKWAAMTRRVRADWPTDKPDAAPKPLRGSAKPAVKPPVGAGRASGSGEAARLKNLRE